MKENAYKEAGVDIEAGAELVERIKPQAKATMRSGVMSGLGGFGAFFDLKETGYEDPVLVSSTDGVGTKLKIAIDTGRHETIGIDLVAMCVNDLVVQGAEPLFFLDYFATGKLDTEHAATVINGIAKGCEMAGCALIGGETAEMPGMYQEQDYDLAGFSVGAVERARIITGERIAEGDVVLGLTSSGVHSNGYSLVRKILGGMQGYSYHSSAPFAEGKTLADVFLEPTRIYVPAALAALKLDDDAGLPAVKGMAHITGGGLLENIPRVLPDGLGVALDASSWPLPPLFKWLMNVGQLSVTDMAQTFNCGIGFVIICAPQEEAAVKAALSGAGESVYSIGRVCAAADATQERVQLDNVRQEWGADV